jgi:hypothetical protein
MDRAITEQFQVPFGASKLFDQHKEVSPMLQGKRFGKWVTQKAHE